MSFRHYKSRTYLPMLTLDTMTSMKVVTLLFLLTFIGLVFTETTDLNNIRMCGRTLPAVVAMYCEKYGMAGKRNGGDSMPRYGGDFWPGMNSQRGLDLVTAKRGIVDDCCYNTCSVETILSYC